MRYEKKEFQEIPTILRRYPECICKDANTTEVKYIVDGKEYVFCIECLPEKVKK